MRDEQALVHRYFSASEIAQYDALGAASRTEAFFDCWTRKEAYVKATGRGIALELDSFDVALDPAADECLLRGAPEFATMQWSIAAVRGPPAVSVAVALQAPAVIVRQTPMNAD
jgi:4'-phosphopantetheinyl transferase